MFFNRLQRQEPILLRLGTSWLLQTEYLRENKLQTKLQILLKKLIDWFISNEEDAVYILEFIVRIHFKIFAFVYQLSYTTDFQTISENILKGIFVLSTIYIGFSKIESESSDISTFCRIFECAQ